MLRVMSLQTILLALLVTFGNPVVAQGPAADPAPESDLGPQVALSLDEAVALVRERTGGRVVRADPLQQGERLVYEIRVLTADGRVRTYRVDAANGAVN